eukprot:TRINITY_DN6397_c0_g1_i2.p1 TRINITY_DN6397_c0_g1~~TRINITY_DN6397_c0_g1_i2.p1  ORF type:complete len:764 (-),score=149.21 TRINITY_DN6397_c0_g1_i2:208-2499(-)
MASSDLFGKKKSTKNKETSPEGMLPSPPMSSSDREWEESKKWICGRGSVRGINFCKVASSIVRDHSLRRSSTTTRPASSEGDDAAAAPVAGPSPSFSSPSGRKYLKPEKWYSAFDSEGKLVGFQKVRRRILVGGVDPSIRAEVWEFLLGCYSLSSTTEFREQLRIARRKRYKDLIEQCQLMHSSIGTGSLAYTVGSKVMDVRLGSKDNARKEAKMSVERITKEARLKLQSSHSVWNDRSAETLLGYEVDRHSSTDSTEIGSMRENPENLANNPFNFVGSTSPDSGACSESEKDDAETPYGGNSFEFPYLPVTNLFAVEEKSKLSPVNSNNDRTGKNDKGNKLLESALHIIESGYEKSRTEASGKHNNILPENSKHSSREKGSLANAWADRQGPDVNEPIHHLQQHSRGKISDSPNTGSSPLKDPVIALGVNVSEDRVADWLWTLHRIVVDVVRTDRHLEFYGDTRNMARMSDILAVYAWVDPMTGYCQGMSDLLSPFIVLFEDDADAFWCFECLLRRMRPNFQMEGPVGVMKQLETLGKILQLADHQLFKHLALIGAESLLFAFRMLLVLFRRELSFNDALCMWEMMWAADFDEELISALEHECLEPLILSPPDTINGHLHHDSGEQFTLSKGDQSDEGEVKSPISENSYVKYLSKSPFCGLRPGDLWNKHNQHQIRTMNSVLKKNGDAEMSVFCVAAILVINRSKIIREIQSMDDAIKMFNEMPFEIKVKHCIHMALKLRKKYFHKNNKHGASKKSSASHSS